MTHRASTTEITQELKTSAPQVTLTEMMAGLPLTSGRWHGDESAASLQVTPINHWLRTKRWTMRRVVTGMRYQVRKRPAPLLYKRQRVAGLIHG